MKTITALFLLFVVISTTYIAGCTQQQVAQPTPQPTAIPAATATTPDTVKLTDTTLGKVLADVKGITLYYFITDVPGNGVSTCYAAANCSHFWPVFSVDNIVVSPPLDIVDFSSITRTDRSKQTTYKGWPLYYFLNDNSPGDTRGEGILKTWYVAKPDYTLMIALQGTVGSFLTDRTGKTLYNFANDAPGTTSCTGACLAKWPAFSTASISTPSALKPADFSSVQRTDGVKQTAYMGRLLYYFADDTKPGDIKGQGFNNLWYVANVSGIVPVVTTSPPTTIPAATPVIDYGSDSGGSGGGY